VVGYIYISIGFVKYKIVVTASSTIIDAAIINIVDNYIKNKININLPISILIPYGQKDSL